MAQTVNSVFSEQYLQLYLTYVKSTQVTNLLPFMLCCQTDMWRDKWTHVAALMF